MSIRAIAALKDNYIWVIQGKNSEIAVVDPSTAHDVIQYCDHYQQKLTAILCTHHHTDHTGGNLLLQQRYQCPIYGSAKDRHRIPGITHPLQENDPIQWDLFSAKILEIPGHTSGHIAYYFADPGWLFAGDTLFSLGCGRLFEGTPKEMFSSLEKLSRLPAETQLYCGHEYTVNNAKFALTLENDNPELLFRLSEAQALRDKGLPSLPVTLEKELKTNPFLRCHLIDMQKRLGCQDTLSTFTEIRDRKDHF